MNILLTTIVDNTNIGTYLQALATVRSLENIGCKVTVLNYWRKYLLGFNYPLERWKKKNIVTRLLYSVVYVFLVNKNIKRVQRFLVDRVKMTKQVNTIESVMKLAHGYDLYLTGSDQVWNCGHNICFDPVYFNGFTEGSKASYAASIGMEDIPNEYVKDFKFYLSKYKYIGVRESSAITALEKIGIKDVKEVIDPTLLLCKSDWAKELMAECVKSEKYLLVYSVEDDKSDVVFKIAKNIAVKKNLKLYYLTTGGGSGLKNKYDKVISNALPLDFLSAFINADFAVVSSFHGTAFSINFNIPFYTVLPNKYNTRVESLLKRYGLEDRIASSTEQIDNLIIDFEKVNVKLQIDRKESINYLKLVIDE